MSTISHRARQPLRRPEAIAHRGYLIRSHYITGDTWIVKDGQYIACARDEAEAKATINMLLECVEDGLCDAHGQMAGEEVFTDCQESAR